MTHVQTNHSEHRHINRVVLGPLNTTGAETFSEFSPTRRELHALAKWWATIELDMQLFVSDGQSVGSDDLRALSSAQTRLAQIEQLLGEEVMRNVYEEAHTEFFARSAEHTIRHMAKYATDHLTKEVGSGRRIMNLDEERAMIEEILSSYWHRFDDDSSDMDKSTLQDYPDNPYGQSL